MIPVAEERRRRPVVLGLIVIVHLVLGYLILSPSAGGTGVLHPTAISGGTAVGILPAAQSSRVTASTPPARLFELSFDRSRLAGPSTLPPPTRGTHATRKVAPLPYPS